MRSCHVRGRAFSFSTLTKTYKLWPTVRCQKGISAWLLCHCTPPPCNCSLKVWHLYAVGNSKWFVQLFKATGLLPMCHEWQPFKWTCMGYLLGMEHSCTCSYLWNASSEFILFPFPFLELSRSSTALFYFNHHIANAGGETATAVIPPWLKVEICAFVPPIFR